MKIRIKEKKGGFALSIGLLGVCLVLLTFNIETIFQVGTPNTLSSFILAATSTQGVSPTFTETHTLSSTQIPLSKPTQPISTPVSPADHFPILSDAVSVEGILVGRWYSYTTATDQEQVLEYYRQQLPLYHWDIAHVVYPNDHLGYIIYRQKYSDFIYIYEDQDLSLTYVEIFLSPDSPSLQSYQSDG